jgi:sulfonate transport system substrate-binding protein
MFTKKGNSIMLSWETKLKSWKNKRITGRSALSAFSSSLLLSATVFIWNTPQNSAQQQAISSTGSTTNTNSKLIASNDKKVIKKQQDVADKWYSLGLIPKKVNVRDGFLTPQQYAAITPKEVLAKK